MVYAFIVHTLFPGSCKVLFYNIYGNDNACVDLSEAEDVELAELRAERKQQIQFAAEQVHSEYQFRRDVSSRTLEDDKQVLNNEDTLPELELGYIRFGAGKPFPVERTGVWLGAGNTGFVLVCHKEENRLTAEQVLRHLIKYLQEYIRVINQPAETSLKADKVCLVLNSFLPDGVLLFMNHRLVRGLEKELEVNMKS